MVPFHFKSILNLSVSLLPVIAFLLVLIALDSYKLVILRSVLSTIQLGCVIAFACLWLNDWLMGVLRMDFNVYARYAGPLVEEALKGIPLIYMIRRRRIGFMVDASIYGFAIGAGFAIIENIVYFKVHPSENLLLWIVRGFGTAVMHGGVTAMMGIISKQLSDRYASSRPWVFAPGLGLAIVIHSAYNHFFLNPVLSTLGILAILPLLIVFVFQTSESATRRWLGVKFDTDADLLEMINTGRVSESRVGDYLTSLKTRFAGEVVVDMLCLMRLHLELSIRAKGILLMRETGFRVEADAETNARFEELKYLEKSIGRTGMRAMAPVFHMSDHDLWQLHMLGKK